jgi:hypothetical protein
MFLDGFNIQNLKKIYAFLNKYFFKKIIIHCSIKYIPVATFIWLQ